MNKFLEWITKNGPSVLALGAVVGLLVPVLTEWARPLMPVTVFIFVLGTLLRIDNQQVLLAARDVKVSIVFPFFMVVICPYVVGTFCLFVNVEQELSLAIALAVAAPPASGNAAVARMLGLDPSMSLVATLCSMMIMPMTAPVIMNYFGDGLGLTIDPFELAFRLALLIGGAEGIALLIRRVASKQLKNYGVAIDGVVVVSLFVFACGTMRGMQSIIIETPGMALTLVCAAYVVNIFLQVVCFCFYPGDVTARFTMALTGGNRNVGLLWSALGITVSPCMALFFACSQLPIHTMPKILQYLIPAIKLIRLRCKKT